MEKITFKKAKAIYVKDKALVMNYFSAYKCSVKKVDDASIMVAAFSFYRLTVNGKFVAFGPSRTAKGYARVDEISLKGLLKKETNEVVLYVAGYNCNGLSTVNQPSFVCAEIISEGEILAYTSKDFTAYDLSANKVQKVLRYSYQRHFSEIYRFDGEELLSDDKICEAEEVSLPKLLKRGAPYPSYKDIKLEEGVKKGQLCYQKGEKLYVGRRDSKEWGEYELDEIESFPYEYINGSTQTEKSGSKKLPLAVKSKGYVLFDFGRVEVGFIKIEFEAKKDSDVIVGFSERDSEEGFKPCVMNTNGAVEYFVKGGKSYSEYSFEPYTARTIIVAVKEGEISVKGVGLKTFEASDKGIKYTKFKDETVTSIYRGAIRTFLHNSVDIYTDCPSRERAGWLCDSYFTAKAEYELRGSTFVEDDFLQNFVLFSGAKYMEKGAVPMCYPADIPLIKNKNVVYDSPNSAGQGVSSSKAKEYIANYIPQWTMWLILEIKEYLFERGHEDKVKEFVPLVKGLIKYYKKYENKDGLLENLPSWNFVEWSKANDWTKDVNYPTNFLYAETLRSAGKILNDKRLGVKGEKVAKEAERQSFNGKMFLDHAVRRNGKLVRVEEDCSEICQYYAIVFSGIDFKSEEKYSWLLKFITEELGSKRQGRFPEIEPINAFIGMYMRMLAMLKLGYNDVLLADIIDFFGKMEKATGTLWEVLSPTASLDHGFASYVVVAINKIFKK